MRLTRGSEFQRVMRSRLRIDGPLFILYAAPVPADQETRAGLSASRRLGGAVARNRAKRLLREAFRRSERPQGFDLVFVPKVSVLSRSQTEVDDELRRSFDRLASKSAHRRGPSPAPAG
jgi:ribonuclease P protein component